MRLRNSSTLSNPRKPRTRILLCCQSTSLQRLTIQHDHMVLQLANEYRNRSRQKNPEKSALRLLHLVFLTCLSKFFGYTDDGISIRRNPITQSPVPRRKIHSRTLSEALRRPVVLRRQKDSSFVSRHCHIGRDNPDHRGDLLAAQSSTEQRCNHFECSKSMAAEVQGTGPHSPNAAKTAAELLYSIVDAANAI